MFNNILCEQFKQNILNLIVKSQLPPVAAYYILKDTLHDLEILCQEAIQKQENQLKQQQNKEQIYKEGS